MILVSNLWCKTLRFFIHTFLCVFLCKINNCAFLCPVIVTLCWCIKILTMQVIASRRSELAVFWTMANLCKWPALKCMGVYGHYENILCTVRIVKINKLCHTRKYLTFGLNGVKKAEKTGSALWRILWNEETFENIIWLCNDCSIYEELAIWSLRRD